MRTLSCRTLSNRVALTCALLAMTSLAVADDDAGQDRYVRKLGAETIQAYELPWDNPLLKPPGPARPGITTIYLHGFEKIYDVYTVAYRFAPGVQQPPHSHPDNRSCFVLAGVWLFAYGTQYDQSKLVTLYTGAHYTEPGDQPHFASAGTEGAIVECTSHGPSGTTYVNPADAPS